MEVLIIYVKYGFPMHNYVYIHSCAEWPGKDGSPSHTLGTIIKKSYINGNSVLSTRLGSKTLNTSSLVLWEPQFKTRLYAPNSWDI